MKIRIIKHFSFCCCLLFCSSNLFGQQNLNGRLLDSATKEPVKGATLTLHLKKSKTHSDDNGYFLLATSPVEDLLEITSIGYKPLIITIPLGTINLGNLYISQNIADLSEVHISTGYQKLTTEKTTGAYTVINTDLLNRKPGTDILNRLEDVTPGLSFNKNRDAGPNSISIRGLSTIFANSQPLVILDNFPYNGDIGNINPNDVASVTVLKDAAAASIWGARAGNGVIVITTKKGRYNAPFQVSANINTVLSEKGDLFYQPLMSSADFIGLERIRFDRGLYDALELAGIAALSPAVKLFIDRREDRITKDQLESALQELGNYDVRNDKQKYLYRQGLNQQYALNMNGGNENRLYYISTGYDRNIASAKGNSYSRFTGNLGNDMTFFNQRLEIGTRMIFTHTSNTNNGYNFSSPYPYARLTDIAGIPTVIPQFSPSYLDAIQQQGLLDWSLNPIREQKLLNNTSKLTDYRLNFNVGYKLTSILKAELSYQYTQSLGQSANIYDADSFMARNLINRFTQVSTANTLAFPIPRGGIKDQANSDLNGHNFRAQLNLNKILDKHSIMGIAGYEVSDFKNMNSNYRLYGYDDLYASSKTVDYVNTYTQYVDGTAALIPNMDGQSDLTDRFISYYANGSYIYDGKYIINASGRLDRSNIFGVKANQKGVPLYSIGIGWNIAKESFYNWNWLSVLKARLTYGYNGNVDKTLSAYTTASYDSGSASPSKLPSATVQNPPNPELRWERVRVTNFGIDFETKGEVLKGSIDLYQKKGTDLIGSTLFPPSSGITVFRGNTADTQVDGLDLSLSAKIGQGALIWQPVLIVGIAKDKVTKYKVDATSTTYLQSSEGGGGAYPLEGKPLFALYSYPWAGLDPLTGDPQGMFNGSTSKDYLQIITQTRPEELVYHGSARPTTFGSLIQNLSWKSWRLSININYRLGYYFRRNSVNYSTLLNGIQGHADYAIRWKNPGDENQTAVPSMPADVNASRSEFYNYASVLVEKGDHVRLQDLSLNYTPGQHFLKYLPFKRLTLSLYAGNLAILWKATKSKLDPDYPFATVAPVRTYSAGLKLDL